MLGQEVLNEHPLRRVPRQRRSRERVERLLDAAAEVFAEAGYDAATTHLIAKRAGTAVGSFYQFFPDKRAVFRALEERHHRQVQEFQARLLVPEIVQLPLKQMVQRIVKMSIRFFDDPAPRVMFMLYYTTPQLFERFDEGFIRQMVQTAAGLFLARNPALTPAKADVIAEVFIQSFNHLMLVALRSKEDRQQKLYQEIEELLVAYLWPHDGKEKETEQMILPAEMQNLSQRQRSALAWAMQQGEMTIQQFEALCSGESRRTLQRDLKALVEQGWLEAAGETNQRVYRPTNRSWQSCDSL
ncbi:Transcriptional regulator, AcrR family [uncultured Synechococcales cyanobacterium]|uniref:Transcriptional regulator, AcrR family n=1 Tax=uncultured Synechococcales cyanobacterium TaxID=1936017 RepID=A0A6J4VIT7_9CYAN|nr:Transcriptional regulator, AcrR family [uncultured Synechococcales cyanobacterium]